MSVCACAGNVFAFDLFLHKRLHKSVCVCLEAMFLRVPVTVHVRKGERERERVRDHHGEMDGGVVTLFERVRCRVSTSTVQPRTRAHAVHPSQQV